ncbi:hypothetical protein TGARI_314700 [Toxoplasma gondii ARI]|uniref:Uncharacterized protein n=2 Tax=Toxoplasma gondii TaxID=5811 RepID=A0A139XMV4_TOXGO|nr:hypothetical protein TGARI_314700 [Toxoplasma gondii ARI]
MEKEIPACGKEFQKMSADLEQVRHGPRHAAHAKSLHIDNVCSVGDEFSGKFVGIFSEELSESFSGGRNTRASSQEVSEGLAPHMFGDTESQPVDGSETDTPLAPHFPSLTVSESILRPSGETPDVCVADGEGHRMCASVVSDSVDASLPSSVGSGIVGDKAALGTGGALNKGCVDDREDVSVPDVFASEVPRSIPSTCETSIRSQRAFDNFPNRELSVTISSRVVDDSGAYGLDRELSTEFTGELYHGNSCSWDPCINEDDRNAKCSQVTNSSSTVVLQGNAEKDDMPDNGHTLVRELIEEFGKRRTNFSVLVPKVLNLVRLFFRRSEMGCWDSPIPAPLPTCAAFNDGDQAKTVRLLEDFFPFFSSQGGLLLCTQGRRLESGGGGKYYFQDKHGRVVGCHKHDLAEYTAQGCVSSPVLLKTLLFCLVLKPLPRSTQRGAETPVAGATGGVPLKSHTSTLSPNNFLSQRASAVCDGTDHEVSKASKSPTPPLPDQRHTGRRSCAASEKPFIHSASLEDRAFPSKGDVPVGLGEREAQLWKAVLDVKELVGQTERLMSCVNIEAGQSTGTSTSPGPRSRNPMPLPGDREYLSLDAERACMGCEDSGEFGSFLSSYHFQTSTVRTSNPQRLVRVYRSLVQKEKTHTVEHLIRVWSVTLHIHDTEEANNCNSGGIHKEQSTSGWESDAGRGDMSGGGYSADTVNSQQRVKAESAKGGAGIQAGRNSRHQLDTTGVGERIENMADTHSHVNRCLEQTAVGETSSLTRKEDRGAMWRPCVSLLWVKPLPLEQSMMKWSRRSVMTEASLSDCCENNSMAYTFPSVVSGGRSYDERSHTVNNVNERDELQPHRVASCASTRLPSHPSSATYTPSLLSPVSCVRGASPGRGSRDDMLQHSLDLAGLESLKRGRHMTAWLARRVATSRLQGLSIRDGEGTTRERAQFTNTNRDNVFPLNEEGANERCNDWERGSRGSAGTDEQEEDLHSLLVPKSRRVSGTGRLGGGYSAGRIIRGCVNGIRQHTLLPHKEKTRLSSEVDGEFDFVVPGRRRISMGGPSSASKPHGGRRGELVEQMDKIRVCQMKDMCGKLTPLLSQVQDVDSLNILRTLVESAFSTRMKARLSAGPGAPMHENSSDTDSGLVQELKQSVANDMCIGGCSHGEWRWTSGQLPVQGLRVSHEAGELQLSQCSFNSAVRRLSAKQKVSPSQLLGQRKRVGDNMIHDIREFDWVCRANESWKRQKSGGS